MIQVPLAQGCTVRDAISSTALSKRAATCGRGPRVAINGRARGGRIISLVLFDLWREHAFTDEQMDAIGKAVARTYVETVHIVAAEMVAQSIEQGNTSTTLGFFDPSKPDE